MSSSNSSTTTVLALKKGLATAIAANQTQDVKDILTQLKTEVKATEELIRETKIGLAVGKLRTHENKEVSSLAKELVKKWKEAVGTRASGSNKTVEGKDSASTSPSVSTKPSPSPAVLSRNDLKDKSNGTPSSKPSAPERTDSMLSTKSETPAPLPAGTVRSSKTDKIDTTQITDDKMRNKCIELIYDSLSMDSVATSVIILERSQDIEAAAYRGLPDTAAYRNKMRSLYLNLKDKKNPDLRASIVSGEIDGKTLWSMSVQELASAEKKAEMAALSKQALFDAQGAAPKKSETDMFQCGKCKAKRATYYQMQTRSADEPMTTFVSCLACGHNWRFS